MDGRGSGGGSIGHRGGHFSLRAVRGILVAENRSTHIYRQNRQKVTVTRFARVCFDCTSYQLPVFFQIICSDKYVVTKYVVTLIYVVTQEGGVSKKKFKPGRLYKGLSEPSSETF